MGKRSKYPSYSSGAVTINGKPVATVTKEDGTITGKYNMTGTEKALYNNIQNSMNSSIKNLFNFTKNQDLWNKQLDAYKNQGIKEIESIYTPMETSLKNDIASRFGNLDNSIFLDKLSNITDNKAQAVASLSDSILTRQDELYRNELTNRINYLTLLSGLETNIDNRALTYLNLAKSNADSGNNYNAQSYQATANNGSFLTNALFAMSKFI